MFEATTAKMDWSATTLLVQEALGLWRRVGEFRWTIEAMSMKERPAICGGPGGFMSEEN
jgi:hypothetical protein